MRHLFCKVFLGQFSNRPDGIFYDGVNQLLHRRKVIHSLGTLTTCHECSFCVAFKDSADGVLFKLYEFGCSLAYAIIRFAQEHTGSFFQRILLVLQADGILQKSSRSYKSPGYEGSPVLRVYDPFLPQLSEVTKLGSNRLRNDTRLFAGIPCPASE